jgi:hypothetical protein
MNSKRGDNNSASGVAAKRKRLRMTIAGSVQSFLDALQGKDGYDSIQFEPSVVQALATVQEQFLRTVSIALVRSSENDESKVQRITANAIGTILGEMGMEEIAQEAVEIVGNATQKPAKKPKKGRQWSTTELEEQERLLASSKEKMKQK